MKKAHAGNLIALSAEFHSHERYDEFYRLKAGALGGFTGICDLISDMGNVLTGWESHQREPWETYDWIQLAGDFVSITIARSLLDIRHDFIPDLMQAFNAALDLQKVEKPKAASVRDAFFMQCPQCGSDETIDVDMEVMMRLMPDGIADATQASETFQNYDDDSSAECVCGFSGTVRDFSTDEHEEGAD